MLQLSTPPTPRLPTPPVRWQFFNLHSSLPMSIAPPPPPSPSLLPDTIAAIVSKSPSVASIGFGYSIAIALGFLVLFSTILLISYICCRSASYHRRRDHQAAANSGGGRSDERGIYLQRVTFVTEDDGDGERDLPNGVVGLDAAMINSYPKLVFGKRSWNSVNDAVCSICLCEYRESEVLRMLPDCKHCFHVMCVDAWLKLNASCPVCRSSPLPTPLSTPLQEVVPLSQYSDGRRRQ